jgi:hypothetical protein
MFLSLNKRQNNVLNGTESAFAKNNNKIKK